MNERQTATLERAYLLHARPYRDSSAIAEFFTREHGRVALVARGVRRPKAKNRSVMQPFRPLLLSWVARGSLGTLTALENEAGQIISKPQNLLSAYYINELILRALRPGDSHVDLYDLYKNCLIALTDQSEEAAVLRIFERDLLDALGYGLNLATDCHGLQLDESMHYQFDLQDGAQPVDDYRGGDVYPGGSLQALANGQFSSKQQINDAKRLLRYAIDCHLGSDVSRVRQVMSAMVQHKRGWQSGMANNSDKGSSS